MKGAISEPLPYRSLMAPSSLPALEKVSGGPFYLFKHKEDVVRETLVSALDGYFNA